MRFLALLLLPLLLSSCYHPVYGGKDFGGASTVQEARLNHISIAGIPNEHGQMLRNFLIDRMYGSGRPDKTTARLEIELNQTTEDLGLQKDATSVRKRITFTANYRLFDGASNAVLLTTTSKTVGSYDAIDAQYGALAAKESTTERCLRELSDLIVSRLLVYYGEKDAGTAETAPKP